MEPYIVKKSIRINAPATVVWDALTNPEKTKQYFFHCEVFSDWKAGSDITFKGKVLLIKNIEMHGKILQVIPGKLLQYRLENKGADDEPLTVSTVTDEIKEENGQTILSITDDVGGGDGAAERYDQSVKGWDKVLSGLKELVEQKEDGSTSMEDIMVIF